MNQTHETISKIPGDTVDHSSRARWRLLRGYPRAESVFRALIKPFQAAGWRVVVLGLIAFVIFWEILWYCMGYRPEQDADWPYPAKS